MTSLPKASPQPPADLSGAQAAQGPLSLTGRRWIWPEDRLDRQNEHSAGAPTPWLTNLLQRRGVTGEAACARFLAPKLGHLDDPAALAALQPALDRLLLARTRGEQIWVYGDYDVDGVCATAILLRFFAAAGMRADFYIPHRQKEGYGLNAAALAELSCKGGLLVTVDCGSTSLAELAQAKAAGLDAIVVDHHQVLPQLPDIVALLNPQRSDCGYAGGVLCAAGLAFMLVVALRRALRAQAPGSAGTDYDVRCLLDLAAVATVADMVPLVGINRVLVHAGLLRLQQAPTCGLRALCEVARVPLAQVDAGALGFRLGPRINARGRMEHAGLGVQLMLTEDFAAAQHMAQQLDAANDARRALEKATVQQAIAQVEAMDLPAQQALVLCDPSWHAGVLGLVASRLTQTFFRPAVVIGEGGKGSARSVAGLNLVAALDTCKKHLVRFGGHPAAAGLTVALSEVAALRHSLNACVHASLGPGPYVPALLPDFAADFAALDPALLACLDQLAPFGRDNAEVLLAAANLRVRAARLVGEDHLKLTLAAANDTQGGPGLDAIGFGLGSLLAELPTQVDALFYLERNVWRGEVRLQARIVDLRASSVQG